jgi:hypothetical protein
MQPSPRDRHLFGEGSKRILALDGGGVRGIIAIAFLERLESLLDRAAGKPVRLCDWFDLVGGTSTGAIIAAAVALGMRTAEIKLIYQELAPEIFRKSRWRLVGRQSLFEANHLRQKLIGIIGDRKLDSDDLQTGLCIVSKRLDTGSSWILMNNPRSAYWDTPPDKSFIGNRYFSLVNLVRASAAAPHFFDPELIQIAEGMAPALFVDGGVSPHNNPSLYMFMAVTLPAMRLNWPVGVENLSIFSVGTGSFRETVRAGELPWLRSLGIAIHALKAQISDAEQLVLALMTWLGESPTRWKVNSELGDLGLISPPFQQPLFRFLRYDIRLEPDWLNAELDCNLDTRTVLNLRDLSQAANMKTLYELGVQAAEKQVCAEHLGLTQVDAS